MQAVTTVAKACRKHDKSLGWTGTSVDEAVEMHRKGVDFFIYSVDAWVLQGGVSAAVSEIRRRCAGDETTWTTAIGKERKT